MNKEIKGEVKRNKTDKENHEWGTNDPKIERNISPRPYGI